jgi:hypothetical protein
LTSTLPDEALNEEFLPPEYDPTQDANGRSRETGDDKLTTDFMDADIGEFIKRPKTAIAREYERKARAILNFGMKATIDKPKYVADAATIIAYGDKLASAAGEVSEDSEWVRKAIDMITSPDLPALAFALVAIPFASQIIRNHTQERQFAVSLDSSSRKEKRAARKAARQAKPSIKLKLWKWQIRVPMKIDLSFLTSQSVEPKALCEGVFSNPDIVKALKKRGINIGG